MDKNAIKKYAVWAREQLIEKVTARAVKYQIVEGQELDVMLETINGEVLSEVERKQRSALILKIKRDGYGQVMEEVAYTWFNRFIAIRFMEVNGYLPSHVRVFSDENGKFNPQILAEAIHLDLPGLDLDKVMKYKEESNEEELFKYLLKVQCNALNDILPQMFQKIEDYTELLLPDYLLREGSVIEKLVNEIPEDNFDVNTENGQIEVIGWMYQYYISAKHEEVVDPLHGKVVKKEEVPAATQLFTTDWVVRYLIDNSVGRYWIERNPGSKLADSLTYFVKPKNGVIETVEEKIAPQDVTVFDPCVGSGHFLVYAFDVLMKIYVEYGFSERDAASEIVKNNLFGLDIDGRAAQLAYFAVMMKARQYDRRFLTRDIQPNVYEIIESNGVDKSSVEYFCSSNVKIKKNVEIIIDTLEDAKEYGSILQIPAVDFRSIDERFDQVNSEISIYKTNLLGEFRKLIRIAEIMSKKYAIVATNPPYFNKYDNKLKAYISSKYEDYKGDLFSVFIFRNMFFCKHGGYSGLMTPMVWMFISTYEKLRNYIIQNKQIATLIQFEYSAYEEATVPICSFVINNLKSKADGQYFRLSDFKGGMEVQRQKTLEAINNSDCEYYFEASQDNFEIIAGTPIAYWVKKSFIDAIKKSVPLESIAYSFQGIITGDNNYFLRLWYEVDKAKMLLGLKNEERERYNDVWVPYNKGGGFRRWYGNNEYLMRWEKQGKTLTRARTENFNYYFREGVTWSFITSSTFSCRYFPEGALWDVAGSSIFATKSESIEYICGLMNSKVAQLFFDVTNPTINYQVMNIIALPYIASDKNIEIANISKECIDLSKEDWSSYETSWDFAEHPFIRIKNENGENKLERIFNIWDKECNDRINKLISNERKLNEIIIDVYDLQDQLDNNIEEEDIALTRADYKRECRSFISYAVGCMFGRYSLKKSGLIYAGGEWNNSEYEDYLPDEDAIIPICDDEYFPDDIVSRFIGFIEVALGKDNLEDNLKFIANGLDGNGSSREIIRNYFLNGFYADHLKVYQKRPIYWMFDSGKRNGFKCLVYMHRYKPDTIARVRTDYIHEQQARYRTAIEEIGERLVSASGSDKLNLTKKYNVLKAQDEELHKYEEKVHHLADQMISINLNDGVKNNYELFKAVLSKIK